MEEPGGLQSMGSQRVGYDWATFHFTSLFTRPGSPEPARWTLLLYPLNGDVGIVEFKMLSGIGPCSNMQLLNFLSEVSAALRLPDLSFRAMSLIVQ